MAPSNKKSTKAPTPPPKPEAPAKQVNAPPPIAPGPQETTALAKTTSFPSPVVAGAPAWLQAKMKESQTGPRGLDKVDNADIILPRLVLAQSMSPEIVKAKELGLVGEKAIAIGDIFDNLTKVVLCKDGEKLEIIPVVLGKSRMFLQPFAEGGGILCRADDAITARPGGCGKTQGEEATRNCADCIHKEWDEDEGKPACSLFYNIVVLLPSLGLQPFVWSCKHTNVKVVRRFLSTAKQTGVDFFALKYALFATDDQSANFKFKNFGFEPRGFVAQEEYQRGEQAFANLAKQTWTPSTEGIEKETEAAVPDSTDFPPPASESTVDAPAATEAKPSDEEDAF